MTVAQRRHVTDVRKPFKALPKRKRQFVELYVKTGEAVEALEGAGYSGGRSANNKARKLLEELAPYIDDHVQKYAQSNELTILGIKVIAELAKDPDVNPQVRFNAAKELKNQGLPDNPTEVHHKHEHSGEVKHLSNQELDSEIARAMEQAARFVDAKPVAALVVDNDE